MKFRVVWSAITLCSVFACSGLDGRTAHKENGAVIQAADGGLTECRKCMLAPKDPGPGCANEFAACQGNELCVQHLECVEERGCSNLASREELFQCGSACYEDHHVDINDPAVGLGYALYRCRIGACGSICHPDDPPVQPGQLNIDAECATQADCDSGEYCCGTLAAGTANYESVKCAKTCAEPNQYEFCDPDTAATCHFKGECRESLFLAGTFVCK